MSPGRALFAGDRGYSWPGNLPGASPGNRAWSEPGQPGGAGNPDQPGGAPIRSGVGPRALANAVDRDRDERNTEIAVSPSHQAAAVRSLDILDRVVFRLYTPVCQRAVG